MATTFESISLTGLRLAHLRQLRGYVHSRDETGWYYGPKEQFEKRHGDLVKWIGAVRISNVRAWFHGDTTSGSCQIGA